MALQPAPNARESGFAIASLSVHTCCVSLVGPSLTDSDFSRRGHGQVSKGDEIWPLFQLLELIVDQYVPQKKLHQLDSEESSRTSMPKQVRLDNEERASRTTNLLSK